MILDFNKLKGLFPYIGSLFIISGYIKLSIFYNHFNIKISDYLEITEILTLFLNDAFIYSVIVICVLLFNFLTSDEDGPSNNETYREQFKKTTSFSKRLKFFIKMNIFLILNLIFHSILLIISFYLNLKNSYLFQSSVFLMTTLLLSNYLCIEFSRKYKITYGYELNATYLNIMTIIALFLTYILSSTLYDIKKTETNSYKIVSFSYDKKEIKSNKNLLYLGVTENYLFMFDRLNETSYIYNRQKIDKLMIKIKTTTNSRYPL